MYEEEIETLFDCIAQGRKSLRVFRTKPTIENGETFVISFLLNVDSKIYNELRAEAERRNLKVEKVVRGYIALCFKQCLADEEVKEAA